MPTKVFERGEVSNSRIEAIPGEKQEIRIRVHDLGFGTWYASSGKVWEYRIDE